MPRFSALSCAVFCVVGAARSQDAPDAKAPPALEVLALDDRIRVQTQYGTVSEYRFVGFTKPVLYPVCGPGGVSLTRRWPIDVARPEEKKDHIHHRGLWFAHGDVNGHDFWTESETSGWIQHQRLVRAEVEDGRAVVQARNVWLARGDRPVCEDERTLTFGIDEHGTWLDYEVTMLAAHGELRLGDTKEGTMAIRLHPALRLRGPVATGVAVNSEGVEGAAAWGKRARWVDYSGTVDGRVVGVAMFDHPANHAHPTWWHARDYGLFAANPFGAHDFEKRPKGTGDLVIPDGESATFRYRFYLHEGGPAEAQVAARYGDYARTTRAVSLAFDTEADHGRFVFSDPEAWRTRDGRLELHGKSAYQPAVRSPLNLAMIGDREFGDFVLEARLRQTGREYGHRDLCLFFGFEDPSHYYYVHLASVADDHAHNVFVVDGSPRVKIAERTTDGVQWGGDWHRVRIERTLRDGRIAVYFDDLEAPVMVAHDSTFGRGRIGFGSFDDTGWIDDVAIWSADATEPEAALRFR